MRRSVFALSALMFAGTLVDGCSCNGKDDTMDTGVVETDTDTDTDADTDTGMPESWDGEYVGTMLLHVEASSLGIADDCMGDSELAVDEGADPQISGFGCCSFVGAAAFLFPDEYCGDLTGTISADPDCDGDLTFSAPGMELAAPWTGGFTDAITLMGEFNGSYSYSGIKITYEGQFEAMR